MRCFWNSKIYPLHPLHPCSSPPSPSPLFISPILILFEFLKLGCVAFGGPMAHLAWFERVFAQRLKWIDHAQLAGLIAVCQALPGPVSTQTAMGIGYTRGGWRGLWAAWIGFTLPSAVLMLAAAFGALALPDHLRSGLVAGMKVAVAGVIAVALWRMGRSLLTGPWPLALAGLFAAFFLIFTGPWVVLLTLALVTLLALRRAGVCAFAAGRSLLADRSGRLLLAAVPGCFAALHLLALLLPGAWTAIGATFYQAGLLVFGGGHVILPLLDGLVVQTGWVGQEDFLFGYGLAQMVPGPLFTFSAYLGASFPVAGEARLLAGLLALAALNLPSFLLLGLLLPRWHGAQASPAWQAVLKALHPAVVGLLLATWVHPVLTSALHGWLDLAVAAAVTAGLALFPRLTLPLLAATAALYVVILP